MNANYRHILLILALLLFIGGLVFPFTHHMYTYNAMKSASYNGSTFWINARFYSDNGFIAQTPTYVQSSLAIPDGYKGEIPILLFKDTMVQTDIPIWFITTDNMSGSTCVFKRDYSVNSSWYESQYSQMKFPFEGDYEAFLLFSPAPNKYDAFVPVGKIIHVSSPETAIMVRTNNILISLSLILTGMTIIQIWISLRRKDKDNNPDGKKTSE